MVSRVGGWASASESTSVCSSADFPAPVVPATRACGPARSEERVVGRPDVREVAEPDQVGERVRAWSTGADEGADRRCATALPQRPVGADRAEGDWPRPATASERDAVRADLDDGVAPRRHRAGAARDEDEVVR